MFLCVTLLLVANRKTMELNLLQSVVLLKLNYIFFNANGEWYTLHKDFLETLIITLYLDSLQIVDGGGQSCLPRSLMLQLSPFPNVTDCSFNWLWSELGLGNSHIVKLNHLRSLRNILSSSANLQSKYHLHGSSSWLDLSARQLVQHLKPVWFHVVRFCNPLPGRYTLKGEDKQINSTSPPISCGLSIGLTTPPCKTPSCHWNYTVEFQQICCWNTTIVTNNSYKYSANYL